MVYLVFWVVAVVCSVGGIMLGMILGYGFWHAQMEVLASERKWARAQAEAVRKRYEAEMAKKQKEWARSELPKNAREEQASAETFEASVASLFPPAETERVLDAIRSDRPTVGHE